MDAGVSLSATLATLEDAGDAGAVAHSLADLASALQRLTSRSAAGEASAAATQAGLRQRCAELEAALLYGERVIGELERRLALAALADEQRRAAVLALRLRLEDGATAIEAEALEHAQ